MKIEDITNKKCKDFWKEKAKEADRIAKLFLSTKKLKVTGNKIRLPFISSVNNLTNLEEKEN